MQVGKLFHAKSEFRPLQAVRPSLMSNELACQDNKRSLKNGARLLFRRQFEVVEMEFEEGLRFTNLTEVYC